MTTCVKDRERALAIDHVATVIAEWRFLLRRPNLPAQLVAGVTKHLVELERDLATMQAAGAEGELLARRWCFVVGLA